MVELDKKIVELSKDKGYYKIYLKREMVSRNIRK
jgi:hypothetical protein